MEGLEERGAGGAVPGARRRLGAAPAATAGRPWLRRPRFGRARLRSRRVGASEDALGVAAGSGRDQGRRAREERRRARVERVEVLAAAAIGPAEAALRRGSLTELFEAFNDLHFLRDSIEGAEFVLALTLEKLPSEVGLVSLFDINKREFVVVRQKGGKQRVVGHRQPERAQIAGSAMRKRHAVVISSAAEAKGVADERFQAIGVRSGAWSALRWSSAAATSA